MYHEANEITSIFKRLKLTFHMDQQQPSDYKHLKSNQEAAIYIIQTIKVNKQNYSLFYDTGCCDMVSRYAAIKSIGSRAKQESSIPISIGGVGNTEVKSNHGIFQVKLSLFNGSEGTFSGVCLDQITVKFHQYPLKGNNPRDLPQLPQFVGGDTDFMLGIKYLGYNPEKVFQLPSGVTIYRSWFKNADGTRGVVGGPHKVFTEIESRYHMNTATFLSDQYKLFKAGYQVNPDASLLHVKVKKDCFNNIMISEGNENEMNCVSKSVEPSQSNMLVRNFKMFEEAENAGSEISYRCNNCRNCKACKEHSRSDMSVKEEVEQDVIKKSITVDTDRRIITALLPLMFNPLHKLALNKDKALCIYNQQVKKLNQNPEDKEDVIQSEAKLQSLGHVEFVKNLTPEQQKMVAKDPIQNFIPWRAV